MKIRTDKILTTLFWTFDETVRIVFAIVKETFDQILTIIKRIDEFRARFLKES